MIHRTLKGLLLMDLEKASNVEELKVVLNRLIASIPTNEERVEELIQTLTLTKSIK